MYVRTTQVTLHKANTNFSKAMVPSSIPVYVRIQLKVTSTCRIEMVEYLREKY